MRSSVWNLNVLSMRCLRGKRQVYDISVIVPVYNCENYLDRSMESLIKQTIFERFEIIVVNDGSTDRSLCKLLVYENNYSNIRIISKKNAGVSIARNVGIDSANGKYIAFFDADDEADPFLYEKLYNLCIQKKADIGIVDYSMVFHDGKEVKHREKVEYEWSDMQAAKKSFFLENLICTNPVDKLFSKEVVNSINFPAGFAIGEDMWFVYKAIGASKKIVLNSNESLYKYCIRANSAMKSEFSKKNFDSVELADKIRKDIDSSDELYEYANANYIHEICKMLALFYQRGKKEEYHGVVKKYEKDLRNYSVFKAVKYMSKKHIFALELMKLSPKIYLIIYKLLRIG